MIKGGSKVSVVHFISNISLKYALSLWLELRFFMVSDVILITMYNYIK